MNARSATGLALVTLGLGIAAVALLGPLVLGVIEFRTSESAIDQLVGGEILSLLVAGPVAVLAGVLWWRGHRLAPVLALAPALYALYTYVQYILASDYARYAGNSERFFPLFLLLIILGWAVAARAWSVLGSSDLPAPTAGVRRALVALLLGLSALFTLAWAASIADVLNGGPPNQAYQDDPTLFWLVRLMDLGVVIPVAVVTAVGLLRRAPWATRLSYAVAGFQTLEVGAVAAMAVSLTLSDDPSADPVLLVATVLATAALAAVYVRLLRGFTAVGPRPLAPRGAGRSGRAAPPAAV